MSDFTYKHDGETYRVSGCDIVNDKTNIVVSTSLAMTLANIFSINLPKPVVETGGRLDIGYLNSLVKSRIKKD